MIRRLIFAIPCLSAIPIALTILSSGFISGQDESGQPILYLITDSKLYRTTDEIGFGGLIINRHEEDVELANSNVKVEDPKGHVIFSQDNAFYISESRPVQVKSRMGTYSAFTFFSKKLKKGNYRAEWIVNGSIKSNIVYFQVQAPQGRLVSSPFEIESIPLKTISAKDIKIAGHFRNDNKEVVSMPDLLFTSVFYLDGQRYKRNGVSWDGVPGLRPGKSWAFFLSPFDYTENISSGEHKCQFEFGGLQSNVIKISWPEK